MWMMILFLGCISQSSKPQEKESPLEFHTPFSHIIPRVVQKHRQKPSSRLPHFLWNMWVCPWRQRLRNNTFTFLSSLKTFPRAEVLKCLWSKLISPNPVDQYTLWVILLLLDITICALQGTSLFQMTQVPHLFWQGTHGTLFLCFPHRKICLTGFAWFVTFHIQQNFTIQLCQKDLSHHLCQRNISAQGLLFSNTSYIPV